MQQVNALETYRILGAEPRGFPKGRTVREFVVAVLFIPAGFTFFWMTVFGNTALAIDTTIANGALAAAVADDISVALFKFFEYLPLAALTSTLAMLLVAVFFITSSDSGSLVVDTIAAEGETETSTLQRVFWCVLQETIAAVLLLAGGLAALQSTTIATALPFTRHARAGVGAEAKLVTAAPELPPAEQKSR